MSNQHAVTVTGLSIPNSSEIVVATMTPFSENQSAGAFGGPGLQGPNPNPGPQGVVFDSNFNILLGTGVTAIVAKIKYGSAAGATIIGFPTAGLTVPVTASTLVNITAWGIDTTLVETNAIYVVTLTLTGATSAATVNYGVFTAQDATSFE